MSEDEVAVEVESLPRRLPLVALVGRPNVGKSTLFNRFVGERRAVVEDRAGTTRDRLIGIVEWNGERFRVVDTGGMQPAVGDPIEIGVQDQARIAVDCSYWPEPRRRRGCAAPAPQRQTDHSGREQSRQY